MSSISSTGRSSEPVLSLPFAAERTGTVSIVWFVFPFWTSFTGAATGKGGSAVVSLVRGSVETRLLSPTTTGPPVKRGDADGDRLGAAARVTERCCVGEGEEEESGFVGVVVGFVAKTLVDELKGDWCAAAPAFGLVIRWPYALVDVKSTRFVGSAAADLLSTGGSCLGT